MITEEWLDGEMEEWNITCPSISLRNFNFPTAFNIIERSNGQWNLDAVYWKIFEEFG